DCGHIIFLASRHNASHRTDSKNRYWALQKRRPPPFWERSVQTIRHASPHRTTSTWGINAYGLYHTPPWQGQYCVRTQKWFRDSFLEGFDRGCREEKSAYRDLGEGEENTLAGQLPLRAHGNAADRKSTRLNSSHV